MMSAIFLSKSWKDSYSSCLLAHWNPLSKGTLKLNINDNFLEDYGILGVGGVVRDHNVDLVGDALLTELRAIQTNLDFVTTKTMTTLFVRMIGCNPLSCLFFIVIVPCTLMLLTSFILEMFYMRMVTLH